jgi:hypothetical protein
MSARPEHTAQTMGEEIDFDQPAQKGWNFFSKFLFWNVIAAALILLSIGALTVWR